MEKLELKRAEWKWEVGMLEAEILQLKAQVAALRAQSSDQCAGRTMDERAVKRTGSKNVPPASAAAQKPRRMAAARATRGRRSPPCARGRPVRGVVLTAELAANLRLPWVEVRAQPPCYTCCPLSSLSLPRRFAARRIFQGCSTAELTSFFLRAHFD